MKRIRSFSSNLKPGSSCSRLFTSARPSASRYSSSGAKACSIWRRETPSRIGISAWRWTSCRMAKTSGRGGRFYPKNPGMRPDYAGGSLVNLVASVVAARGGEPLHEPLKKFQLPAHATNLVLLIIDGLGDNYLQRRGASELGKRRRGSMTSVFPSTTASAITTSYTGATPLEHGLTGWFTYFGEAGCVSAALPFRSRGDMQLLSTRGVTPEQIYTVPSLFGSMPVRSVVVSHRDIIDSHYNSIHCRGAERLAYEKADDFVDQIERAVKSSPQKKF